MSTHGPFEATTNSRDPHLSNASSKCFICGVDTPHGHSIIDRALWVSQQAQRVELECIAYETSATNPNNQNDRWRSLAHALWSRIKFGSDWAFPDDDEIRLINEIAGLLRAANIATAPAADSAILEDDLRDMLRILGLGDHARPQSPHLVFRECIAAVEQLRQCETSREDARDRLLLSMSDAVIDMLGGPFANNCYHAEQIADNLSHCNKDLLAASGLEDGRPSGWRDLINNQNDMKKNRVCAFPNCTCSEPVRCNADDAAPGPVDPPRPVPPRHNSGPVEATLENRDPSAFKDAGDTLESLVREVLRAGEANLLKGPNPASVLAEGRWYARAEAALARRVNTATAIRELVSAAEGVLGTYAENNDTRLRRLRAAVERAGRR